MTTELDTLLRAADPARDLPPYDDERIRAAVTSAVEAGPVFEVVPPPARTPYLRRTAVRVGIAAAVAAAVLVVPVLGLRGGGAASPAAAAVLRSAASISATDPVAAPDQWYRVTTTGSVLNLTSEGEGDDAAFTAYSVPTTRTVWVAVDGSRPSWFTVTTGAGTRISGPGPSTIPGGETSSWTTDLAPSAIAASWQVPNSAFLAALPRDTDDLRDRVYADSSDAGLSRDGAAFVYIADVLRSGLVPADLRSALFTVLATIPGVEVTAAEAEIDGVEGVAIGRLEDVNGFREEIVVDPATGQVVGERSVTTAVADGMPIGTLVGETRVTRAVVDDVPADVRATAVREDCTQLPSGAISCTGT